MQVLFNTRVPNRKHVCKCVVVVQYKNQHSRNTHVRLEKEAQLDLLFSFYQITCHEMKLPIKINVSFRVA